MADACRSGDCMITANDLLLEAKSLLVDTDLESRRRSAMSRAYYAAYHAVNAQPFAKSVSVEIAYRQKEALERGNNPPGSHSFLIKSLKESKNKKVSYAGSRLSTLYERRIFADYKILKDIEAALAEETVSMAQQFN